MLKLTVIGNIGADPDMRYSASGAPFLRFNVAGNFRVRSPEGEWQDKTEWVRVTVFGQRAESLQNLLKKGMRVYVEGRLEARPWTDQQGQLRAGLEVTALDVEFMSPRQDDGDQMRPPRTANAPAAKPSRVEDDGELQDVPF